MSLSITMLSFLFVVRASFCLALLCTAVGALSTNTTTKAVSFFGGADNTTYSEWLDARSSRFDHALFLQSTSGVSGEGTAFHWSIVDQNDTTNTVSEPFIRIAVAAQAKGWVGFGFAENGGMRGSDMVLFRAASPNNITDAHVMTALQPIVDECQSWTLEYSQTHGGFLVFEATRLLDTDDPQDRKLADDSDPLLRPHLLISAWGDDPTWTYHGMNRAKSSARLFGDGTDELEVFRTKMKDQAEGSFYVGAHDYAIPVRETTYRNFCFNSTFLESQGVPMDQPLHVIGVEPIIDNRTTKLVHHMIATSFPRIRTDNNGECRADGVRGLETLYGWAPGVPPFNPPDFLGYAFGKDNLAGVEVQIHYNNPGLEQGHIDNSGVIIYWTSALREYDIGTIALADPATQLRGNRVSDNGLSKHTFGCPSSCTRMALSGLQEPITVFQEVYHMHASGRRAETTIFRDGQPIRESSVDFFDYDQNGFMDASQESTYKILPGDSFTSSFFFENPDTSQQFGLGSQDEMAITSLRYYPQQKLLGIIDIMCAYNIPIPSCHATYNHTDLVNETELKRPFGAVPKMTNDPVCTAPSNGIVHFTPTDATDGGGRNQAGGEEDTSDLDVGSSASRFATQKAIAAAAIAVVASTSLCLGLL